jgi:hypothetical protein
MGNKYLYKKYELTFKNAINAISSSSAKTLERLPGPASAGALNITEVFVGCLSVSKHRPFLRVSRHRHFLSVSR